MGIGRLLVLLLICAGLASCARASDDAVRGFFEALDRGDTQKALSHFSPELRRKFSDETLRGEAERWTETMREHGGLGEVELDGGVVTYNVLAFYKVTLVFHDGKTRSLSVTLSYVDGEWYINAAV